MNTLRFLRRGLIYCLFLLLAITAADFILYRIYCFRNKIPPRFTPCIGLSDLSRLTGPLSRDKKSGYWNASFRKDPGIIRIGCFGDSFTQGDEVNQTLDYPSLLQNLLDQRGLSRVQILNFGNSWHGFHQAYLVWKELAADYQLDGVLIGPRGFWQERDSRFNHAFPELPLPGTTASLHARFILDKQGVRLLSPVGKNVCQLSRAYVRFIPAWRYLRYDTGEPFFLKAPIELFTPNRSLRNGNPFYYRKDIPQEMGLIYRALLNDIAQRTPWVFLGNYERQILETAKTIRRDNFSCSLLLRPHHFPYQAFGGHNGPLGNLVLAQQMLKVLLGETECTLTILKTENLAGAAGTPAMPQRPEPLGYYDEAAFLIRGQRIGSLFRRHPIWPVYCCGPECAPIQKPLQDIHALLYLRREGQSSLLDDDFINIPFDLREGMPALIRTRAQGRWQDRPLGTVSLLHPGSNIGSIEPPQELPTVSFSCEAAGLRAAHKAWRVKNKESALLLIDGKVVAYGRVDTRSITFFVPQEQMVIARASGVDLPDIDSFPEEGTIELALRKGKEAGHEFSCARWRKTKVTVSLEPPGRRLIKNSEPSCAR